MIVLALLGAVGAVALAVAGAVLMAAWELFAAVMEHTAARAPPAAVVARYRRGSRDRPDPEDVRPIDEDELRELLHDLGIYDLIPPR